MGHWSGAQDSMETRNHTMVCLKLKPHSWFQHLSYFLHCLSPHPTHAPLHMESGLGGITFIIDGECKQV